VSTFVFRADALASLTDRQRAAAIALGDPCSLGTGGGSQRVVVMHDDALWPVGTVALIWDDARFRIEDAAYGGALLAQLPTLPDDVALTPEALRAWLGERTYPDVSESENPWLDTLIANGASPLVAWMGNGEPAWLRQIEGDE
jgi:hypothetical protein